MVRNYVIAKSIMNWKLNNMMFMGYGTYVSVSDEEAHTFVVFQ